jgi:hypothetical protein
MYWIVRVDGMASQSQPNLVNRWWRSALIVAVGGALFAFALLWAIQALGSFFAGGRLLERGGSSALWALTVGWALVSVAGYVLLRRLLRWGSGRSCLTVLGWMVGYMAMWLIALVAGGVSLAIYAALWLALGALGGLALASQPPKPARRATPRGATAGFATMGRARSASGRRSTYGRVPEETAALLREHVRQASGPIAAVLPQPAPPELRAFTIRAALDRMIRDWWSNENMDGLTAKDIDDLQSFVALAAALAGTSAPLSDPEAQAVYRATLAALLDDWLANWNADGVDGPPRRA